MNIIDRLSEELNKHTTKTGNDYISKFELDLILSNIRLQFQDEKSLDLEKRITRLKNTVDIMNQNGMMEERNIENRFLNLNIKS